MTIIMTDPARELAEVCQRLHSPDVGETGELYLAKSFGVEAYSREFYQIVFCILERIDFVKNLILDLDLDDDLKDEAVAHVDAMKMAFSTSALRNSWYNHGSTHLAPVNVQPLKMLANAIRQRVAYPSLSPDDISEIEIEVAELLGWLKAHQLSEQDFIRQALIDGLSSFLFRLSKVRWLGYGYSVASLREVIAAYMALERAAGSPADHPDAAAMMQKTASVIRGIYEKIVVAKDVVEAGDFMLKAYGAVTLVTKAHAGIAGLLPGS